MSRFQRFAQGLKSLFAGKQTKHSEEKSPSVEVSAKDTALDQQEPQAIGATPSTEKSEPAPVGSAQDEPAPVVSAESASPAGSAPTEKPDPTPVASAESASPAESAPTEKPEPTPVGSESAS